MIYDYELRHLTEEEAEHVLNLIKDEDPLIGLVCEILYRTGRRISELLYLTKRNMKYQIADDSFKVYFPISKIKKTMIRSTRVRRTVEVTIPANKIREWEEVLSYYGSPPKRTYFFSSHSYKMELDITLRKRYERVLKNLHYEDETIRDLYFRKGLLFHVWRHSYAWRQKNERKVAIDDLSKLMAHKSLRTTMENYLPWYIDSKDRYLDF